MGKLAHHICNNQDFMKQLKGITLGPDEAMVSYDVRALFTSVPIKPALEVIEKLLKEDPDLQKRTNMSTKHIMDLLEFCLRSTYFTYRGKFYEQVEGAAMGSPISPIVANLFMENFEMRALQSSPTPLYCGRGLLMTPLSSWRRPTRKSSWPTSTQWTTIFSSHQKNQDLRDHYPSWTS